MSQTPLNREALLRTQTFCLLALAIIACGFSLYFLQSVLLPFVIAVFVVIGCRPILEFLQRRLKLHWFLAFIVTFSIGVSLLVAFAFFTWLSIGDLSRNAGAYQRRIDDIVNWTTDRFPGFFREPLVDPEGAPEPSPTDDPLRGAPAEDVGQLDGAAKAIPSVQGDGEATKNGIPAADNRPAGGKMDKPAVAGGENAQPGNLEGVSDPDRPEITRELSAKSAQAIQDFWDSLGQNAGRFLISLASSLTSLLSYAVLILIFVFFLLLGQSDIQSKPPAVIGKIETQIRKYLVMKTVISASTGTATAAVLWLFGVPLAIVFGFLAFLLNYIPNIGPLVANLLPVPFLILSDNLSPMAAIICFILISAIQFVSGNVIETRVMGKSFDVSPVVLLLALMFFGLIWGIVGMFLATPIVSVVKIVLQQNPATRPLGELMAGRWETAANPQA